LSTGEELKTFRHTSNIWDINIIDSERVVFGSYGAFVYSWKTGTKLATLPDQENLVMSVARDGDIVFTGSVDETCLGWSLTNMKVIYEFDAGGECHDVGFFENKLVGGVITWRGIKCYCHLRIWNLNTKKSIDLDITDIMLGHLSRIYCIKVTRDRIFVIGTCVCVIDFSVVQKIENDESDVKKRKY